MEGNKGRGRPQRRWSNEMKELPMKRGLGEREGMVLARDREPWGGWCIDRSKWKVGIF